jgi:hypothetical protein
MAAADSVVDPAADSKGQTAMVVSAPAASGAAPAADTVVLPLPADIRPPVVTVMAHQCSRATCEGPGYIHLTDRYWVCRLSSTLHICSVAQCHWSVSRAQDPFTENVIDVKSGRVMQRRKEGHYCWASRRERADEEERAPSPVQELQLDLGEARVVSTQSETTGFVTQQVVSLFPGAQVGRPLPMKKKDERVRAEYILQTMVRARQDLEKREQEEVMTRLKFLKRTRGDDDAFAGDDDDGDNEDNADNDDVSDDVDRITDGGSGDEKRLKLASVCCNHAIGKDVAPMKDEPVPGAPAAALSTRPHTSALQLQQQQQQGLARLLHPDGSFTNVTAHPRRRGGHAAASGVRKRILNKIRLDVAARKSEGSKLESAPESTFSENIAMLFDDPEFLLEEAGDYNTMMTLDGGFEDIVEAAEDDEEHNTAVLREQEALERKAIAHEQRKPMEWYGDPAIGEAAGNQGALRLYNGRLLLVCRPVFSFELGTPSDVSRAMGAASISGGGLGVATERQQLLTQQLRRLPRE